MPANNTPAYNCWGGCSENACVARRSLLNPLLLNSVCKKPQSVFVWAHAVTVANPFHYAAALRVSIRLNDTSFITTETPEQLAHLVSLAHVSAGDSAKLAGDCNCVVELRHWHVLGHRSAHNAPFPPINALIEMPKSAIKRLWESAQSAVVSEPSSKVSRRRNKLIA